MCPIFHLLILLLLFLWKKRIIYFCGYKTLHFFLLSSGKIERNKKKLLMCLYQQFETAFSTGKVTQNKNTYLLSGSSGSDFGHSCLLRIQKDFLYT